MARRKYDTAETGRKFGRLTVIKYSHAHRTPSGSTRDYWLCLCECGTEKAILAVSLVSGVQVSCGCFSGELTGNRSRTHGMTGSPVYAIWSGIIDRCTNPNSRVYRYYGGRGVSVCQEWRADFEAFYLHIGPRPSDKHSVDRYPNKNGNYEPGNVRWATSKEQNRNTNRNHYITFNGRTATLTEWAQELGVHQVTLRERLETWSVEDALTRPKRIYSEKEPNAHRGGLF